jgi:MFS family permease
VPLGGAIGALLLPWLAGQGGFTWIYALLAALCALSAGLCWAWVREPDREAALASHHARASNIPTPLRDPQIWRMVAGIGLLCAPQFAVLSFGTVFLHDFAGLGLGHISAAMALVQLGAMGLRIWSGRWTDQRGNRPRFLRACALFIAAAFFALSAWTLLVGSAHRPAAEWLLCSLLVISGLGVSAWHGVAYAELGTRAGAMQSGTALGMANTCVFVVCFVTPLAIAHILALQGWPLVWLLAALVACVARPLLTAGRSGAIFVVSPQNTNSPRSPTA